MRRPGFLILAAVLFSSPGLAQAPRDAQALALAGQAYQAMAGPSPLTDATLAGTTRRLAGSDDESGAATLQARGYQQSRAVESLTSGQRQQIRNQQEGAWSGPDGLWHAEAAHNCWVAADWFFPAFTLQAALADPTWGVVFAVQQALDQTPVNHLVLYRLVPGQPPSATALIERLTTVDVYLDAASGLPLALGFDVHPDGDASTDLPVQIRFSDYHAVSGVQVPFRIRKFLQGGLVLDMAVSSAAFNTGLPDSLFAVPATVAPVSSPASGGAQ